MSTPTVICVLGMHRSGTSVISRLLNLLGVSLGPDASMMPPREDNPRGFWEHHPLVQIDDEILARFGGHWDRPPAFPPGWVHDQSLDDLRSRARAVITTDFGASPLWGWKDPRACLTLPFWIEVVGQVRCVVALRNPANVVASLVRRDAMSPELAADLWLTHVASGLEHSSGLPRLFLFHEDVMSGVILQLRRLAAFIGQPDRAESAEVQQAALAYVEDGLWHHRATLDDLAGEPRIPFAAKGLYLALRHATSPTLSRVAVTGDEIDRRLQGSVTALATQARREYLQWRTAEAERAALRQQSTDQADALAVATAKVAEQSAALAAAEARAVSQARVIADALAREAAQTQALGEAAARATALVKARADAESRAGTAEAALAALEHAADDLRRGLEASRRERDEYQRAHAGVQGVLDEIQGSAAWRMVSAGRRQIVRALPAGTARRRWLDAVLRRVRP